jgi:heme/copper-type cytochrome/quinol oxidase subunit 4
VDVLHSVILVGHFIGLAAIVGPFVMQARWKGQYAFPVVLGGAITQLVTGLALVGLAEMGGDDDGDLNYAKIGVKLTIAVIIFVAALLGFLKQRKSEGGGGRELLPFFHAAGGLALVNITLAVFW